MVVWLKPCKSRSSPGALSANPRRASVGGLFLLRVALRRRLQQVIARGFIRKPSSCKRRGFVLVVGGASAPTNPVFPLDVLSFMGWRWAAFRPPFRGRLRSRIVRSNADRHKVDAIRAGPTHAAERPTIHGRDARTIVARRRLRPTRTRIALRAAGPSIAITTRIPARAAYPGLRLSCTRRSLAPSHASARRYTGSDRAALTLT
jgi:hypothetical protein